MAKSKSTERVRRYRQRMKEKGMIVVAVEVPKEKKKEVQDVARAAKGGSTLSTNAKAKAMREYRAKKKAEGYSRLDLMVDEDEAYEVKAFLHALRLRKAIAPNLCEIRRLPSGVSLSDFMNTYSAATGTITLQ